MYTHKDYFGRIILVGDKVVYPYHQFSDYGINDGIVLAVGETGIFVKTAVYSPARLIQRTDRVVVIR